MKLHVMVIVCCAATIFAAPAKNEEAEADVKAKGKISVEVKPIDLQVKLSPTKIHANLSEKRSIATISTTTEAITNEPTETDLSDSTPKEADESVQPEKSIEPAVKKHDKLKVIEEIPKKGVERSPKQDAANVVVTVRTALKKSMENVAQAKSKRLARGRSRFRSANIEATEKPDEKESKNKPEQDEQPNSLKRDMIKLENIDKEKKNEVNKVEKVKKEKEEKIDKAKENDGDKESESEEKPKAVTLKALRKVASAKNDAAKSKHNKVESRQKDLPKSNEADIDSERPKEQDEEESSEKKESRSGNLSAEERRNGRKYHDIQIVQLESEIEEDGRYRYNYEGEDGTLVEQEGELKRMGDDDMGESVKGAYSYQDDDGKTYSVSYTADENGYRPIGDHIPTIPPAIARALAWAATAKPWVDPWLVEQERLKASRESRKLLKKEQKKGRKVKPARRSDENENGKFEIEDVEFE